MKRLFMLIVCVNALYVAMFGGTSSTIVTTHVVALPMGQTLLTLARGSYMIPYDTCHPPDSNTYTLRHGAKIVQYGHRHSIYLLR